MKNVNEYEIIKENYQLQTVKQFQLKISVVGNSDNVYDLTGL